MKSLKMILKTKMIKDSKAQRELQWPDKSKITAKHGS